MDTRSVQFLAYAAFSAGSLAAGYLARKRDWLHEDASRRVHFHTYVWLWPPITFLSLWNLPLKAENLWFVLLVPLMMAIGAFGIIPLAKAWGRSPGQVGVLTMEAGQSNLGFTLGAYLSYCLLTPQADALSYGMLMVSIMQAAAVLLLYPLARHYGEDLLRRPSLGALIADTFWDLRATIFYAALAGWGMSLVGARHPSWAYPKDFLVRYHVMETLIYIGGFGAYFGIGLRLRLGRPWIAWREHVLLAAMKFGILPLAALLLLTAISFTPWPITGLARQVFIIEAFMPTAIAAIMLSNLFGLDARLASVLWLWNTIFGLVLSLPVLVFWFGSPG